MSANTSFQIINEQGWRMGFANILRHEHGTWWHTRRWWINTIIWLVLVNGAVLAALSSTGGETPGAPPLTMQEVIKEGMIVFAVMTGLFGAVGAIIVIQGAIIDEKKSGTAAWIMSKPASRAAFILAKLIANSVALLCIVFVFQGAIAYLQISQYGGEALPLLPFLASLAMLGLNQMFYLSLTLMLGTIFTDRGPVIAIPLGVLFSSMFIAGFLGPLAYVLPWMILPIGGDKGLAIEMMTQQPLSTVVPIIATTIWIVCFVGVALRRFQREEF